MNNRSFFITVMILAMVFQSAVCGAESRKAPETNPSEVMETYLGDVVADAIKVSMDSDMALINGGSLGYKDLPEKINRETLPLLVPFGSDLVVAVKIKGDDLVAVLEKSMSLLPRRSSSLLQVSGISMVCDLNRKPGERIVSLKINGKPVNVKSDYIVATTDFLAGGGGGLTPFRNGKIVSEKGIPLDEIVIKAIKYNKGKIDKPAGRIVIIPLDEKKG